MIHFAYNPTSWDGGPIPGGMADRLVQPILPHLDSPHDLVDRPQADGTSVYLTFARTYPDHQHAGVSVFLSHGIADKQWRDADRMAPFDWVCVSGPAWTQRLVARGFPPERLIEAGYTKLDPIFAGQVSSAWPERDGRIRVLWAPTHGGGGEKYRNADHSPETGGARRSTYWSRDRIIDSLPPSEFDVMVALHPRHRPDRSSTLAEYVGADVVIADGGSTIYEAWALDLPVVFPTWIVGGAHAARRTFEAEIFRHRIGRHALSPSDLPRLAIEATDGITRAEQAYIEPILPRAYRGISGRMHAEALDDIAAHRKPRHSDTSERVTYLHNNGTTRTLPVHSGDAYKLSRSPRWRTL